MATPPTDSRSHAPLKSPPITLPIIKMSAGAAKSRHQLTKSTLLSLEPTEIYRPLSTITICDPSSTTSTPPLVQIILPSSPSPSPSANSTVSTISDSGPYRTPPPHSASDYDDSPTTSPTSEHGATWCGAERDCQREDDPWLVRVVLDLYDVQGFDWMMIAEPVQRMWGYKTSSADVLAILQRWGRIQPTVWWD